MDLAEFLIRYREEHDLSQRALAAQCGLSNGYIGMLERRVNPRTGEPIVPSIPKLQMIAAGIGIPLAELMATIDDVPIVESEVDQEEQYLEYLEELRRRPELRVLFNSAKGASKEQIEAFVKMIDTFKVSDN